MEFSRIPTSASRYECGFRFLFPGRPGGGRGGSNRLTAPDIRSINLAAGKQRGVWPNVTDLSRTLVQTLNGSVTPQNSSPQSPLNKLEI